MEPNQWTQEDLPAFRESPSRGSAMSEASHRDPFLPPQIQSRMHDPSAIGVMVMNPPHWTDCRKELADRLGTVPRLLVASDFDGTLAPVCPHPEEARLPEETRRSLASLAGHPGVRVAVLSGRELSDVARLVDLPKAVLAGNHGLEIKGGGMDYLQPQALAARPVLDAAAAFLTKRLESIPGSFLAHKGLTLSLHFRQTGPEGRMLLDAAAADCAARFPTLKVHRGRMVAEFRPDVAWNKGFALKRLLKGLGLPAAAALYMGDDTTDEDAFAVLNGLGTSLHVSQDPKSPTRARYRLRDPEDTAEFLDWLKKLRVG